MFQELLGQLYALELYYKTCHWQVKNSIFYGDHLLLDRLSEEAGKRIDQVAEKAIGVTGNTNIVNLPEILKKIYDKVKGLDYSSSENARHFERGLQMEQDLQSLCKLYEEGSSIGVRNLLGDLADESEGRIYLLKQRLAKPTPVAPVSTLPGS